MKNFLALDLNQTLISTAIKLHLTQKKLSPTMQKRNAIQCYSIACNILKGHAFMVAICNKIINHIHESNLWQETIYIIIIT